MSRYATTDIHGCLHTFRRLVEEELHLTFADELYLLGDYVNKGPDSKGVLDYLMQLQADGYRVHCLRGNHDQALLDDAAHRHRWGWLSLPGRQPTLRSFGVRRASDIPLCYLTWLDALPYEIELPDFVLVHAGYNFALPPSKCGRTMPLCSVPRNSCSMPRASGASACYMGTCPGRQPRCVAKPPSTPVRWASTAAACTATMPGSPNSVPSISIPGNSSRYPTASRPTPLAAVDAWASV